MPWIQFVPVRIPLMDLLTATSIARPTVVPPAGFEPTAEEGVNVVGQVGQHLGPAVQAGVDENDLVVVAGCAVAEQDIAETVDVQNNGVR